MKFATILAITTTAYGLAFDGPRPTPVTNLVHAALNGFTPKPTNGARSLPELFRRQQKPSNSAMCGYLESDPGMSAPGTHYPNPAYGPQPRPPPTPFHLHRPHYQPTYFYIVLFTDSDSRLSVIVHCQRSLHLQHITKMVRMLQGRRKLWL